MLQNTTYSLTTVLRGFYCHVSVSTKHLRHGPLGMHEARIHNSTMPHVSVPQEKAHWKKLKQELLRGTRALHAPARPYRAWITSLFTYAQSCGESWEDIAIFGNEALALRTKEETSLGPRRKSCTPKLLCDRIRAEHHDTVAAVTGHLSQTSRTKMELGTRERVFHSYFTHDKVSVLSHC